MKFQTITPPEHLADFVRFFWFMESDARVPVPYIYRSMADSCVELIFHYKGTFEEICAGDVNNIPQDHSLVHAQTRQYRRFICHQHFGIFGVYLYPYAIPRLFSFSATDISDLLVNLHDFLGRKGKELEEQMMLAPDNQHRLQILSDFLSNQLTKQQKPKAVPAVKAIEYIIQKRGLASVKELAAQSYLSVRQFERKFKTFSGFSPKLYTRIVRFQRAMNEYGNRKKNLTQIAYDCGYYDQSHFIRDFKSFSGYHPKLYFSGLAEGIEYRESNYNPD